MTAIAPVAAVGHAEPGQHPGRDLEALRRLGALPGIGIEGRDRQPRPRQGRRDAGPHGAQADDRCLRHALPLPSPLRLNSSPS